MIIGNGLGSMTKDIAPKELFSQQAGANIIYYLMNSALAEDSNVTGVEFYVIDEGEMSIEVSFAICLST